MPDQEALDLWRVEATRIFKSRYSNPKNAPQSDREWRILELFKLLDSMQEHINTDRAHMHCPLRREANDNQGNN